MNPYMVLGIKLNASKDEIKKAHRRWVKVLHPDNKDGDKDKFARVQEAYEILMDDDLREEFDRTGVIPKKSPNNLSSQAHQLFMSIFINVVQELVQCGNNPEQHDLVKMIRNKAEAIISKEIDSGIENSKKTIDTLNKMLVRFKSKHVGVEPFSHSILRTAIEGNKNSILHLEEKRKVVKHLITMLDEITFEADSRPINISFSGTSSSSWTTSFRF